MTLLFKNPELERGYAAHYSSNRAKSDWMGMLLEASLWTAGFTANYRQGRLSTHFYMKATFILSSCFGISFLSRFRSVNYQRHRNLIAVCWRLSSLLWPSFLLLMRTSSIRSTQKFPIMTAIFGSSLLSNILTTICMPLLIGNSFIFNVLLSIRHLVEQYKVCSSHQTTCSISGDLAAHFWDVLALLNPFGLGSRVLAVDVLSPPQRCFLVYLTSEVVVLAVCWWVAWCIERQNRMIFLRQTHAGELERNGKQELFNLLLHEPLGVGVRLTCLLLFGISLMWACVLSAYSTLT